jgi:hypothetical protein
MYLEKQIYELTWVADMTNVAQTITCIDSTALLNTGSSEWLAMIITQLPGMDQGIHDSRPDDLFE